VCVCEIERVRVYAGACERMCVRECVSVCARACVCERERTGV